MQTRILWKQFEGFSYLGAEPGMFLPFFPQGSAELLLRQLLNMPKSKPLSYRDACRKVQAEGHAQIKLGNNDPMVRGSSNWLTQHWVEWLIQKGYHVELQGDEFEILTEYTVEV